MKHEKFLFAHVERSTIKPDGHFEIKVTITGTGARSHEDLDKALRNALANHNNVGGVK